MFNSITEFWEIHGPIVEAHLTDLKSLKSVFGGDIFPSYASNIACSLGLYVDTVVLPDPLGRIIALRKSLDPKEFFRLTIKHALNALSYRELALAELDPPLVVIAPDQFGSDLGYSHAIDAAGSVDALIHASRMFNREFENPDALISFVDGLGSPKQIVAALANRERLLFDSEWNDDLPTQLERYRKELSRPAAIIRIRRRDPCSNQGTNDDVQ